MEEIDKQVIDKQSHLSIADRAKPKSRVLETMVVKQ